MDEGVEIALVNNRLLGIASEERVKADYRISEAVSGALPTLSVRSNYDRRGQGISIKDLGELDTAKGTYTFDVTLEQPIYKGGKTFAAIGIAKLYERLAEQGFEDARQRTVFDARRAYLNVLLASEVFDARKESVKLAGDHVDYVAKYVKEGIKAKYDLLRAKVELANEDAQFLKAKNAVNLARTTFLNVLGLPLETEFELTDELLYSPEDIEVSEAFERALKMRPDYLGSDIRIAMQRKNLSVVRADARPSLSLTATWEGGTSTRISFGGDEFDQGWFAGAVVRWPFFDGFSVRSKVKQEEGTLRQLELQKVDLEKRIELEIKQAVLSIDDAKEIVMSQRQNIEQAAESLRETELRFRNGISTELDLLDARTQLRLARTNLAQGIYAHEVAQLTLKRAMGIIGK